LLTINIQWKKPFRLPFYPTTLTSLFKRIAKKPQGVFITTACPQVPQYLQNQREENLEPIYSNPP
jgi:hypothetical protein